MKVYVVTMYRYGDNEKHSYVLGVWSNSDIALAHGEIEKTHRGGKYDPKVEEFVIDASEYSEFLGESNDY